VEQANYGHPARKATWLYAHGVPFLPSMRWGAARPETITATVSWLTDPGLSGSRRRIARHEASATPPAFRDALLSIARSVYDSRGARVAKEGR
jgi:hypothetical protein